MPSIFHQWGVTPDEKKRRYPCDAYVPGYDLELFRAVTVNAPADMVFRRLCQMRVAPYSYDWLDNFGRTSPRELIPHLVDLEPGQRFMDLFELVDFDRPGHVTLRVPHGDPMSKLFGRAATSYCTFPHGESGCRLVNKIVLKSPPEPLGWLVRFAFPPGDWIMMRKQLLNFKRLAEDSAGDPVIS